MKITLDGYTLGVIYTASRDELKFSMISVSDDPCTAIDTVIDATKYFTANIEYLYKNDRKMIYIAANADTSISQYNKSTVLYFILDPSASTESNSSYVQDLANAGVRAAFSGWEILMRTIPLNLSLKDLGFTSYM